MGYFDKTNARLSMMQQMMSKTNTDLSKASPSQALQFPQMVQKCLNCSQPQQCQAWLSEIGEQTTAPEFCPNHAVMNSNLS